MARFFMAGSNIAGGRAVIRGQDAEHIRVLRLRPGEDLVICDGRGTDYRCRLVSSAPRRQRPRSWRSSPAGANRAWR